jgi:hypothetical protein
MATACAVAGQQRDALCGLCFHHHLLTDKRWWLLLQPAGYEANLAVPLCTGCGIAQAVAHVCETSIFFEPAPQAVQVLIQRFDGTAAASTADMLVRQFEAHIQYWNGRAWCLWRCLDCSFLCMTDRDLIDPASGLLQDA